MIKLNETDAFLMETKLNIMRENCRCPDGFDYALKADKHGVYITLQCVTYDGEVYSKDIRLANLLKMNEKALVRYTEAYLS